MKQILVVSSATAPLQSGAVADAVSERSDKANTFKATAATATIGLLLILSVINSSTYTLRPDERADNVQLPFGRDKCWTTDMKHFISRMGCTRDPVEPQELFNLMVRSSQSCILDSMTQAETVEH